MRTTVDIPDPIYRALKSKAAAEGSSVRELIVQSVLVTLRPPTQNHQVAERWVLPQIKSAQPGTLKLGVEGVYEYIPFP